MPLDPHMGIQRPHKGMPALLIAVGMGALLLLVAWVAVARYGECREMGFSRFYCATSR
ncbi:MAG: hypothetical protein U1E51_25055 [Candidatus Binatia bacterium]|nr:hypothetical protein [Candidatus Binatia bacterium]